MEFGDRFLEIFSTVIFFIAVVHIFISVQFLKRAHQIEKKGSQKNLFSYSCNAFLGNAALIFGLWLIPILIVMALQRGPALSMEFFASINWNEPLAYFVLITVATVRPLRNLFDTLMHKTSHLFGNRIFFFWAGTLLLSSVLTGVFSNVAIMALACLFLSHSFFPLKPSVPLSYLTFALLLLCIAVGETIIPVNFSFIMDGINGDWSHLQIFFVFGWKVFLGLILLLFGAWYLFKKEFKKLQAPYKRCEKKRYKIRLREITYALLFLLASFGKNNVYILLMVIALVIVLHKPYYRMKKEEGSLQLYFPLLIAFFTLTLEMHASLQKWWVLPLFQKISGLSSYPYAFFLTGLNEHIPLEALKVTLKEATPITQFYSYLGVLAGGGLTIIAKSANMVSNLTLKKHFPHHAISPLLQLFIAIPLALLLSCFISLLHYLGV